jgi:predicted RNA-binding Zn ribbon-like protein
LILALIQPPVRRRGWRYTELITCPADLREWLDHERGRLAIPAEVDTVLVARFVLTRDHVLRVLRAGAGGAALPAADVHAINELAAAPAIRLLGTRPGQHLTRPVTRADQATRLCAGIAAAAIDLLTGPDAATVALCDAPGCGQLYLRGRPNQQCCNPHCIQLVMPWTLRSAPTAIRQRTFGSLSSSSPPSVKPISGKALVRQPSL